MDNFKKANISYCRDMVGQLGSCDWNAVIDGYLLFRKDKPARQGGGVALYVRE